MLAGATGLEPAASCVTGRRSNQLNYAPAFKKTSALMTLATSALRFPKMPPNAVTAKRKVVTYRKHASRMAPFGAVRNDREPLSNPYQTHDLCPVNLCPPVVSVSPSIGLHWNWRGRWEQTWSSPNNIVLNQPLFAKDLRLWRPIRGPPPGHQDCYRELAGLPCDHTKDARHLRVRQREL
jgi:hypothetical protein